MIKKELSELKSLSQRILSTNAYYENQTRDLKRVCNVIKDLILIVNPDCTVKYVNEPMLVKLGLTEDKVLGKNYIDIVGVDGLCGVTSGAFDIKKMNGRFSFECHDIYDGDNFMGFICNFRELSSCTCEVLKQMAV